MASGDNGISARVFYSFPQIVIGYTSPESGSMTEKIRLGRKLKRSFECKYISAVPVMSARCVIWRFDIRRINMQNDRQPIFSAVSEKIYYITFIYSSLRLPFWVLSSISLRVYSQMISEPGLDFSWRFKT